MAGCHSYHHNGIVPERSSQDSKIARAKPHGAMAAVLTLLVVMDIYWGVDRGI